MSAYDGGLPAIGVGSFSQIGATSSIPRNRVDSNWHFVDNYSWKTGKHDMKFGYEFRRTTIMQVFDHNFRGTLSFNDLSDFLQVCRWRRQSGAGRFRKTYVSKQRRAFYPRQFPRDCPSLTLNYGLRWDYFGVTGEKNGLFYTFNPANGGSNDPTRQLYGKDLNNFAPRARICLRRNRQRTRPLSAADGACSTTRSLKTCSSVILPWNCIFCPGPAYPGLGPQALATGSVATGGALRCAPGRPVYSGYGPEGDFFSVDPHMRTPYIQNFNLNFQQQMGSKTVLQLGYVGSMGTKLFQFLDINQPSQAANHRRRFG